MRASKWRFLRPSGFGLALLITAFSALVSTRPAAGITGTEVIDRMQESFAKAKTFSARFEKQLYWAVLDKNLSQKGRIYTRKPGQFRVELDGSLVVADGQTVWVYTEKNEQVIVGPYDEELSTPWEILIDYAESFSPLAVTETKLAGRNCYLVTLEPKKSDDPHAGDRGQVVRLKVWVDKKRWHLLQVEELKANDDVLTYTLEDHRAGKKLEEDLFVFEPPDGVQVIDRRPTGAHTGE